MDRSSIYSVLVIGWFISLGVAGFLGFSLGKPGTAQNPVVAQTTNSPVPNVLDSTITSVLPAATNLQPAVSNIACDKTGLAKPWEYLTTYTINQGDSLESIAKNELNDSSRVNELLKINGSGPFVAGSALYLPPKDIPKSSGNLQQVYGKLVESNDSSWHISYTADLSGQGVLIPTFLFNKVANKDSFKIGDCIKVFFDNGYTVYSVSLQ